MRRSRIGLAALIGLAGVSCIASLHAAGRSSKLSRAQRLDAIHHAKVWSASDIRAKDVRRGPPGPGAFQPGALVTCSFVNRPHGRGSTRKFTCADASGHNIKVRYGRDNGEVYAQVAATRLLWALGFPATRMYPVRVMCRGCSAEPFKQRAAATSSKPVLFDPATIEVKAEGKTLETEPDEGWSWKELDLVDGRAGGASVPERDALKLLAVLMQHSSNKAINQRLVCADPPGCSRTWMMILDVGKTFGRANPLNNDAVAAVNFHEWSRLPIWKESPRCIGNLPGSWTGTLHDPTIGEAGRKLLSDLLQQLSDAQLHDLFDVARFPVRDPGATVADWVDAFKRKRAEIAGRRCPE